jgi:molybdate transport system substrate-binding protein
VASPAPDAGKSAPGPQSQGTLTVFAATSLTAAMETLAREFEAARPGIKVQTSCAGSQELQVQVEQGARCDVFAAASPKHMQALVDQGLIRAPREFAANQLCIIVKPGADMRSAADLQKPGLKIVVAVPTCPAGQYTRRSWEKLGKMAGYGSQFISKTQRNVISEETNVKLVLAKVKLGEADAGFVYTSDAQGQEVDVVGLPEAAQVMATYLVGVGSASTQADLAEEFIALLRGPTGSQVLREAGLEPLAAGAADTGDKP